MLSISNRILISFAAAILLMVGLGVYALSAIGEVRQRTETIVSRDVSSLKALQQVQNTVRSVRESQHAAVQSALGHAMGRKTANIEELYATWRRGMDAANTQLDDLVSRAQSYSTEAASTGRAENWRAIIDALAPLKADLRTHSENGKQLFAAVQSGDLDAVENSVAAMRDVGGAFSGHLDEARAKLDDSISLGQQGVSEIYNQTRTSLLFAVIGAAIIAILITLVLRNSIIQPLGAFMGFVERVGQGDLAGQTAATGGDEIGRLGSTLNGMVEGLRQLARQSREAAEELNASAAEIRASTQEQAASVEEQLAAVQETAATVDEITHAGAQVSKRAQEVIQSAQATAQTSSAGLRAVTDLAGAMDLIREQAETVAENIVALSEKTQAISDIITSVNDISERSHLLALNAAIEAAAAGESGRSFAVVASEMKTLADQAKDATVQVRSILGDIQRGISSSVMLTEEAVKRAATGKERTDLTTRTIEEMTTRMQESVQTFQQIVASTNQQQLGIEQVMGALQNIREASQQTAAGTRQLDTAAGNLSETAQQILVFSSRYRI